MLNQTKQNCLHSEPNYGVLWFYFKDSVLENAFEIWSNATSRITADSSTWMGSSQLVFLLEHGLHSASSEEQMKVIYGHEQILPVISHS